MTDQAQDTFVELPDGSFLRFDAGTPRETIDVKLQQFRRQAPSQARTQDPDAFEGRGAPTGIRQFMSLKLTPEGKAGLLESYFGVGNVKTDAEGNFFVREEAGKPFGRVDPEGFEINDLVESLAGPALELPLSIFGRTAAGAATGAAAGNLLRQGVSEMLPGDDNLTSRQRVEEVGTAAITGGALQGGIGALGRGADAIRPQNIVSNRVNKLESTPQATEGRAVSQQTGVPLTLGQETSDPGVLALEQMARRHPASAGFMRDQDVAQMEKALGAVEGALNRIDSRGLGAFEVGAQIQKNFNSAVDKARNIRTRQATDDFGKVHSAANGRPIVPTDNVRQELQTLIDEFDVPGGGDATAGLVNQLKRVQSEFAGAQALTGQQLQRLMQVYSNTARNKGQVFKDIDRSQQRLIAGRVLSALERDLDGAVNTSGQAGDFLATSLRTARDNYRNNSQFIDELRNTVLGRMFNSPIKPSPEAVADKMRTMRPSEITQTIRILQSQDPEMANGIARHVMEKALEKATVTRTMRASDGSGVKFSPDRFLTHLPNDETVRAVLAHQPNAIKEVRAITEALERIADQGAAAGQSPTAPLMFALDVARGFMTTSPGDFAMAGVRVMAPRHIAKAMTTPQGRSALRQVVRNRGLTGPVNQRAVRAASYLAATALSEEAPSDVRPAEQPTE